MSTESNDGGPAFPIPYVAAIHGSVVDVGATGGMSLRDYLAAAALQGMLAADGNGPRWVAESANEQPGGGKWLEPDGLSKQAYLIADAMLKARKL